MKKYLLHIFAAVVLASCTKQPYLESKAIPCAYDLDTTIVSTEYHIAAVDGDPLNERSWNHVKAVYTDSVRISHVHKQKNHDSQCVIDTTYARRDTFTDVRSLIGYLPEWNGWVIQQMILNRRNSSHLE